MKRFLYLLCQWTWGLPQNLAGGLFYLWYRLRGCPHFRYHGAFAVIWTRRSGSMSMGSFLFMHPNWTPADRELLNHEYGHTIQSLFFGPLYLLTVGMPSILWAGLPVFRRMRREGRRDYYSVYPEHSASALGRRFVGGRADAFGIIGGADRPTVICLAAKPKPEPEAETAAPTHED